MKFPVIPWRAEIYQFPANDQVLQLVGVGTLEFYAEGELIVTADVELIDEFDVEVESLDEVGVELEVGIWAEVGYECILGID